MFVLFARLMSTIVRRTELYLASSALVCILIGASLFSHFEHLTFWKALYWSITTAATVGYGDVTPSNTAGQIIAISVMLTCIPLFGALFSVFAARIAEAKFRRLVGMENIGFTKDHVLVLGDSDETLSVVDALHGLGPIVVVANDIDPTSIPNQVSFLKGDPRDANILHKARATHAKHAIITGTRDGDILETAIALKEIASEIPITVSTRSELASRALQALGIDRTLVWQELLGHTLAKSLQAPHAGKLLTKLVNSDEFFIKEIPVTPAMVGQSFHAVRTEHPEYVLGLAQGGEVMLGVREDVRIDEHASLLILKPQS